MRKILLDTSLIIDHIRQKDKDKTLLYLFTLQEYELHISLISYAELMSGKSIWESSIAKGELEAILSDIKTLQITHEITENAGKIRAQHSINLIDAIIGATALSYNLPFATLNIKDFEKIRGLHILKI